MLVETHSNGYGVKLSSLNLITQEACQHQVYTGSMMSGLGFESKVHKEHYETAGADAGISACNYIVKWMMYVPNT